MLGLVGEIVVDFVMNIWLLGGKCRFEVKFIILFGFLRSIGFVFYVFVVVDILMFVWVSFLILDIVFEFLILLFCSLLFCL